MRQVLTAWSALAIALILPSTTRAELVTDDWGSWGQVVAEGDLGFIDPGLEKGRLWLEGQMRWDGDWRHWYQGVARTALGYSLSDRATVWIGYTFVPTQNIGKSYVVQQDVWPAFRYVLPTEYGTITFRTMFEASFFSGDQARYQFRQMFRYLRPFDFEPRLSLIVWDEIFVRLNSTAWGGLAGFGQNRAFLGAGWSFDPALRVELGYMNQYIDVPPNQTIHNLVMGSLFINF
ncbi:MAG: DUF2490 domain-containing protein [Pseudomonadota bacterium]